MNSHRGEVATRRDRLQLTFAYRSFSRTLVVPRALAIVLLGLLPFVATLYLAATCYFVFRDDLLASLTKHQVEMQYAYEDRIASLRHELENVTEQARADQADLTDRVQALAQRQDQVESRTALVAALAERVNQRTPDSKPSESAVLPGAMAETAPLADPSPATDGKPHPEGFDLRPPKDTAQDSSSNRDSRPTGNLMSPIDFTSDLPLPTQIHLLLDRCDRTDSQDLAILEVLRQPAMLTTAHIRAALDSTGLVADRLSLPPQPNGSAKPGAVAMGGPFVALPILSDGSSFAVEAGRVEGTIDTLENLRRVLPHVPLAAPLPGELEVTSPFGPRIDPFLGTLALHTGVDLLGAYGAPVRATAAGTVVSAGFDGGYGNMVEIDHGNGLTTRYAHLSSITVVPGQAVSLGAVLGHIGATGRATGPHLHYEVRIDGEPVDPERFLRAGTELLASAAGP